MKRKTLELIYISPAIPLMLIFAGAIFIIVDQQQIGVAAAIFFLIGPAVLFGVNYLFVKKNAKRFLLKVLDNDKETMHNKFLAARGYCRDWDELGADIRKRLRSNNYWQGVVPTQEIFENITT